MVFGPWKESGAQPAEAISDEVNRRKRRARSLAVLSWLSVNLALLSLGAVSIPLGFVVAVYVYIRVSQGPYLVVWFRRFNADNEKRAKFHWLLQRAVKKIGVVVTLQDSLFKYTYLRSAALLILTYFSLSLVVAGSFVVAGLIVLAVYGGNADHLGLVGGLSCLIFILLVRLNIALLRRNGYLRLRAQEWQRVLGKNINSIVNRKAVHYGLEIYGCGDGFWKDAVHQTLSSASAAVIDVNDVTANVAWEVETALQYLPPESIILAYSPVAGIRGVETSAVAALPDEVCTSLEMETALPLLELCRVFEYARRLPPLGPARRRYFGAKASELRALLIGAVAKSSIGEEARGHEFSESCSDEQATTDEAPTAPYDGSAGTDSGEKRRSEWKSVLIGVIAAGLLLAAILLVSHNFG